MLEFTEPARHSYFRLPADFRMQKGKLYDQLKNQRKELQKSII